MPEQELSKTNSGKHKTEPGKQTDSNKKPVLFIVISTIISITAAVFTFLYLNYWYVFYDAEAIAKVRERAVQKWDAANAIPAQDNGWFQYEQAMNVFSKSGNDKEDERIRNILHKGITPQDYAFIESLKKKNNRALSLVDEGYGKPEFQMPIDYSKGHNWMPNNIFMNNLPYLLLITGDYQKLKGNFDEAARKYLQVLYLAHGLKRNSFVKLFNEMEFSENRAVWRLHDLIAITSENGEYYKTITQEMEKIDQRSPTLSEVFEFELALNEFLTDDKVGSWSSFSFLSNSYYPIPRVFRKNVFIRDQKAESSYLFKLSRAATGRYKETNEVFFNEPKPRKVRNGLPLWLGTTIQEIPDLAYRSRANFDGVKILATLKWYRKEKGEYPDNLAALVPGYLKSLPKDPFTDGEDYRYIKEGDSVLIYSIGPDLKDDKGNISSIPTQGDIVFKIGKPSVVPVKRP